MQNVRHGFTLWKKRGVRYLVIPSFNEAGGALCAISTRVGGVSPKPYDTLNFSRKRENNEENFQQNIARFADAAGFEYKNAVAINYAHSAVLHRVEAQDAGAGIVSAPLPEVCDGLFSDKPGLPMVTYHADCAPIMFYDPKRRAAAICHAGWRGIAAHIAANAVHALMSIGCRAGDILAAVGPCISVAHYEVGDEVAGVFRSEFGSETVAARNGRLYADLPGACVIDMINNGIVPDHITVSDICTYDMKKLFFSHRRDNGMTGAFAAVIELRKNKDGRP